MASQAAITQLTAALDRAEASLDALLATGASPADGRDAIRVIDRVERLGRKVAAAQVGLLSDIDRRGLHRHDGHHSAKVLVRHVARLSDLEAGRRAQAARALRDLPQVAAALAAGRLGMDQVGVIARAHANPRVRERLCRQDAALARLGAQQSFVRFQAAVLDWTRIADADGTADTATRNHANRNAALIEDPDGSWRLRASCGSLRGATHRSILDAFTRIESDADWARARAEHGDAATVDHLARTAAQRRADALDEIFRSAADAHAAAPGGSKIVTNLVIDRSTFERELRRFAGTRPDDLDVPLDGDGDSDGNGGPSSERSSFRSSTLDGDPVAPSEIVAEAIVGHVRRVVVGAGSVVVDLGREQRLYTGLAALAVRLSLSHCSWPGCLVPASHCQLDHLHPWALGGRTDPGNGAPHCGIHNRHKERGYRVTRDARGRTHTYRPDGTEIL